MQVQLRRPGHGAVRAAGVHDPGRGQGDAGVPAATRGGARDTAAHRRPLCLRERGFKLQPAGSKSECTRAAGSAGADRARSERPRPARSGRPRPARPGHFCARYDDHSPGLVRPECYHPRHHHTRHHYLRHHHCTRRYDASPDLAGANRRLVTRPDLPGTDNFFAVVGLVYERRGIECIYADNTEWGPRAEQQEREYWEAEGFQVGDGRVRCLCPVQLDA